jgi:hypothetical protein
MNESHSSLGDQLLKILATIIAVPLLLGGLIAVGDSGDGRVLLYGGIVSAGLGAALLTRKLQKVD